jgi:hypothetical protein
MVSYRTWSGSIRTFTHPILKTEQWKSPAFSCAIQSSPVAYRSKDILDLLGKVEQAETLIYTRFSLFFSLECIPHPSQKEFIFDVWYYFWRKTISLNSTIDKQFSGEVDFERLSENVQRLHDAVDILSDEQFFYPVTKGC